MNEPPSIETLRALARSMGLDFSDAELGRLLPEVTFLWRHAARLRELPVDGVSLLDEPFSR